MDKQTLIERLKHVRELIEQGWVKGILYSEGNLKTSYCLDGACRVAAGWKNTPMLNHPSANWRRDLAELREVLVETMIETDVPYFLRDIVMFNDYIWRTKEEVLELVDNAILYVTARKV